MKYLFHQFIAAFFPFTWIRTLWFLLAHWYKHLFGRGLIWFRCTYPSNLPIQIWSNNFPSSFFRFQKAVNLWSSFLPLSFRLWIQDLSSIIFIFLKGVDFARWQRWPAAQVRVLWLRVESMLLAVPILFDYNAWAIIIFLGVND